MLNVNQNDEVEKCLIPLLRNQFTNTFAALDETVLENYYTRLEAAFGPKALPILDLLKANEAKNLKAFFQIFKELLLHLRLNDPAMHFKQLDPYQPANLKYD